MATYDHLGYNKNFLEKPLPLPTVKASLLAPLIKPPGNEIKYTHFSLIVSNKRLLPLMSAVNIRGEEYAGFTRAGNEPWDFSTQIKREYQIDNRFYGKDANTFDRGHLVRRLDPCWGTKKIAVKAENETFRWVNCTPQHSKLNREGGVWLQLEQHVLEHGVKNKLSDISVFAGPVLADNDQFFINQYLGKDVAIPVSYWKIIVWKKADGKLNAVGFMMSQLDFIKSKLKKAAIIAAKRVKLPDDYFEKLKFKNGKSYQVPITAIEKATGIKFSAWKNVNFPYASPAFKLVKGSKLRKPRPLAVIKKAKEAIISRKAKLTPRAMATQIKKIKSPGRKVIAEMESRGPSVQLKKYNIKNVTL